MSFCEVQSAPIYASSKSMHAIRLHNKDTQIFKKKFHKCQAAAFNTAPNLSSFSLALAGLHRHQANQI